MTSMAIHSVSFRLAGLSARKCISWWAMDLVGKPNTTSSPLYSCHPSAFVQVSSSSRDGKRSACQVCIGEAFSKLAKYEQDSGKLKMRTRNVTTYCAIPILQRAHAAHEELTPACMVEEPWIVSKPDAASQYNRLSLSTGRLYFVSARHK